MQNVMSHQISKPRIIIPIACALLSMKAVHADSFLINSPNLQPTSGLFMLAAPTSNDARWALDSHIASHAAREVRGNDQVLFDGETSEVKLAAQLPVSDRWAVSLSGSYRWHTKGTFDPFIDSWHKVFGLPEGIRDERPRDALRFDFTENGTTRLQLSDRQRGLGDVVIAAHYKLNVADSGVGSWTLSTAVKLPTGDSDKLTGSGGTDIGMTLAYSHRQIAESPWGWSAHVGAVVLGDASLENLQEKSWVASGQLSATYAVTPSFSLGARLQGNSSVVQSSIDIVGDPALQLITGGEWRFADDWALRITVAEDILVDHSPDVTFRIGLASGF